MSFLTTLLQPLAPFIPEDLRILAATPWRGTSLQAEKRRRTQRRAYRRFASGQRELIMRSIANFCFINRPVDGYYMEFGCCSATTMRLAWDAFHWLFDWHFIGFDSFEGFPDIQKIDRQVIWQKGKAKMDEEEFIACLLRHGVPRERFRTVRGFYDQSLTPELCERLLPTKAAVIYVDCDLYHSTVPVLRFVEPFLQQGTILALDDWNAYHGDPERGERLAFREFAARNPAWHFEPFVATHMAQSFICIQKQRPQAPSPAAPPPSRA